MSTRDELLARIGELAESISTAGCMDAKGFAIDGDLTLPQIGVLYVLASGPAKITEISQAQGMAPPNASSMVERLVRKDLVERVSDPKDRRVALARLTHAGREVIDTLNRSHYEAMEKIAAFLSVEELEVVAQALEVFQRGVGSRWGVGEGASAHQRGTRGGRGGSKRQKQTKKGGG
ncbi:MAG: MarR family transcriptional regulator, partial [Chloroflexota bacterium]|nr:MarR family transcriptional regulator [Chloroflexota bacterium]